MTLPALPAPVVHGGGAEWGVVAVFAVVYAGMFLGGLPHVKLDRTGVALLGAIAMIAITGMPVEEAARSVDLPTLVLLFAFMVVSAQMRLGGFYAAVTRFVAALPLARGALLAALIAVAAALSAVFSNDVVCLAMTPVVARLALERRLDPVPLLVGLACAANIGSALTLIGNPQNMLIGSLLALPSGLYAWDVTAPADITEASLARVFAEEVGLIEHLLVGTGLDMLPLHPAVVQALRARRIVAEPMATGAAARTYNILMGESRLVAAALIAV